MTLASTIGRTRPRIRVPASVAWPLALALAVAAYLIAPVVAQASHGVLYGEDDAYYYTIIARHVARQGLSSFDGVTLTNGYHPLWLLAVVLQQLSTGPSLLATLVLETALAASGLWLLLRTAAVRSAVVMLAFALAFARLASAFIPSGMEEGLLVCAFALTVAAATHAQAGGRWAGIALGLAGAAAIGARLDAAVFVLPLLALAPAPRRTRLEALAVVAGCGLVYGLYNEAMFGMATPISGAIKSMGGLQLNHRLIQEVGEDVVANRWRASYPVTLAAILASPALIVFTRRGTVARTLTTAVAVGGWLYLGRLLFASSWRVWSWYNYPVLLVAAAALFALGPRVSDAVQRWTRARPGVGRWQAPVCAAVLALLCAHAASTAVRPPPPTAMSFALINREAVRRFAPVLAGRTVAMGDRAGSFADAYPGPVLQMEGLVGDRAWLKVLREGGDLRPALCARSVGFVAAYDVGLGAYRERHVDILRPRLTQARSPYLTLRHEEEVGAVGDLALYDGGARDPDNTLHLWRLTCPSAQAAFNARRRSSSGSAG